MGKFIRRLFIILVVLTIAFLIYRYINPAGASKLVDTIKTIPDTISGGSSQDAELNITGTTLVISGDIDVLIETGNVQEDEKDGLSWLEELNNEIDEILGTDSEELTGDIVDENMEEDENLDFLGEDESVESCIGEGEFSNQELNGGFTCCDNLSGFVKAAGIWLEVDPGELCYAPNKGEPVCSNEGTEQEGRYYENGELLKIDNNCYVDISEGDDTDETPTPPAPEQGGGLTDADYQQIEDVFGNLVE